MCFSLPSARGSTLPDVRTDCREAIDCIDNSPMGALQVAGPVVSRTLLCTASDPFVILLGVCKLGIRTPGADTLQVGTLSQQET